MGDLKRVYKASRPATLAASQFDLLAEKWSDKYPIDSASSTRKLTKTKGAFPNQESLLKLLYLGIQNASRKWTMRIQNGL